MKIVIEEIRNIDETEVIIKCKEIDDEVKKLEAQFKLMDTKILAKKEDRSFALIPSEIYYFESIDNKVFAYLQKEVYEVTNKLYELEEFLKNSTFLRVNKNTVLNASKIHHFKSTMNGRMEATLKNKEVIVISRTYVSGLKMMLGGLKK
ncbi:MAG: LytTR family transcriptional regulator DNA-binding domain-containing protein [Firmicutes bacterium]|nr:LytTR family transcriptional regulator DNA-binding domain-containing protein [Bacillota bacterium]